MSKKLNMDSKSLNKYLYVEKTPTWLVRGIFGVGILTWLYVIYGYSRFIQLNPIFFIVIFPIVGFLILYHLISYLTYLFYEQFDLKAHGRLIRRHELFASHHVIPPVDIFLPICGESNRVLIRTFVAVSRLNYPKKKVYVLDDKGMEDHELLARSLGFTYLSRGDKGYMKKAGNLKHGFDRSNGDFIAVLDADFAPHPDFIKELLPYMDDLSVGIVQSPQYFPLDKEVHRRSPLEYGAAYVQEDFYRMIQVARDKLGAPICCGSNAIYRRKALDAIGGTVQMDHSEDMYTGFALAAKKWRVKYVPIILALGLCPDNLHAYFHQQHRWCSGNLSLMLDKTFWKSNLSFMQKLCFISGFMYYLSHLFTIILSFQIFFLLFFYKSYISLWDALPFIPCLIFTFIVIPLFRTTRQRFGGYLARNAYMYSYAYTSITAFMKKSVGWQPTNIKVENVSSAYLQQTRIVALYLLLYVGLIGFSIGRGVFRIFDINYYSLLFWVFYTVIATVVILSQLFLVLDEAKQRQLCESKGQSLSLFFWRLKMAGGYIIILLLAFITPILH
jgi:cellulose synthase (UDP-forming)